VRKEEMIGISLFEHASNRGMQWGGLQFPLSKQQHNLAASTIYCLLAFKREYSHSPQQRAKRFD
jgi:hypothetical protein